MSKDNRLWVKKYAPQVIDDIIFKNDELQKKFNKMVKDGNIPNMIFAGVQGSGKSTLSNALVRQLNIQPADHLRINASSDGGIDVMRNQVMGFASTMPLGDFKVVQIEEFRLSPQAQESIRATIEDSSDTCRFIITTNYVNKIIPSLKSRFQEYIFSAPEMDKVFEYAFNILDQEGISDVDADLFEKIVSSAYPDIRKIVQVLQQYSHDGKLHRPDGDVSNQDYKLKLLDFIEADDYISARKVVCEQIAPEEYDDTFNFLYQNIHRGKKFKVLENEQKAIVIINDHLYKHSLVAHPHINLAALFIQLGAI